MMPHPNGAQHVQVGNVIRAAYWPACKSARVTAVGEGNFLAVISYSDTGDTESHETAMVIHLNTIGPRIGIRPSQMKWEPVP